MKKIMLPIIIAVFFTSCTEIYYPAPQPEFAKELTEIPEKFQGEFWRVNSIMNDTIIDSSFYVVTENQIKLNEGTWDSENTVFKSWLNYLFLNQKEDSLIESDFWGCIIIHTNGLKGENERITYKQIKKENVDWSSFDLADTDEGNSHIYIQNLSTTQFHYLLKKAEGGGIQFEIHRIK